jgi:hypothetical protein
VFIPTGLTKEASQDDTLHKVFLSSPNFRGKDHAGLHQLFRDCTHEIYDMIVSLDADILDIPEDYYTALSDAVEAACDRHYVELSPHHHFYFFEYYKINKVGGANNPYESMQWPGIHIPHAIINLLDAKDLLVNFIGDNGGTEQHLIQFHERNPAGRGLDFDDARDDNPDFVRYVVEFRCQNPITDTKKTPLPPLEELARRQRPCRKRDSNRTRPPARTFSTYYRNQAIRRISSRTHKDLASAIYG